MSSQELVQAGQQTPVFDRPPANQNLNAGAVAIEQERAIAEAQGQLTLAKKFPRSMAQARADLLEACKDPQFAAAAFYSVPNRGSGPSIRFAEEVARCYGNFQYGHRELSRVPGTNGQPGKSEIEVFAWDMEKNNYSKRQITVIHTVDTRQGPKILRDQTDIDNRVANVASKQMRGRILALVPKELVAAGIEACTNTNAGNGGEPVAKRIARMTDAFAKYGIKIKHLCDYIKRETLDDITPDEIADLQGVYNAIKEGAPASEYFGKTKEEEQPSQALAALNAASGTGQDEQPKGEAEPKAEEKKTASKTKAAKTAQQQAAPAEQKSQPEQQQQPAETKTEDQNDDNDPPSGDLF